MGKKQLPEDFKDFIKFLNLNNVEYLLIGGWAVSIYGNPRLTKDIDFLISTNNENIDKFRKALEEFGAPSIDLEKFKKDKDSYIRMGKSPIQIDVLKKASGIIMEECYKRKKILNIDNLNINIISINDLIKNKRSSGRDQDITDANKLEKLINVNKNEYTIITQKKSIHKQSDCTEANLLKNNNNIFNADNEKIKCYKHETINTKIYDTLQNMKLTPEEKYTSKIAKLSKIYNNHKYFFISKKINNDIVDLFRFKHDFSEKQAMAFLDNFYNNQKKDKNPEKLPKKAKNQEYNASLLPFFLPTRDKIF